MMISDRDMEKMKNDVVGTLGDWKSKITIKVPKPLVEQLNWNAKLREFIGEVLYISYEDVPVECVEGYFSKQGIDVGGDRDLGSIVVYVPIWYKKDNITVNITMPSDTIMDIRILYRDEIWRIKSMKNLIGEYSLNIYRMVGE